MTKTLVVLCALALSSTARADAPSAGTCAATADRAAADGVVFIHGAWNAGTGFLVRDGRHVATALHVLQFHDEVGVQTRDRRRFTAHVVAVDEAHDLAILEVAEALGAPLALAPAAPERGQPVAILGHPGVLDLDGEDDRWRDARAWALTAGVISQVTGDAVLTDASAAPGNSGGPLLDCEGRVLGVVQKGFDGDSHIGATPSAVLAALLARVGRDREVPGAPPRFDVHAGFAWLQRDHTESAALDVAVSLQLDSGLTLRLDYQVGPAWPDRLGDQDVAASGFLNRGSLQLGYTVPVFWGRSFALGLLAGAAYVDWRSEHVLIDVPDAAVRRERPDETYVALTGSASVATGSIGVRVGIDLGWPHGDADVTFWTALTVRL